MWAAGAGSRYACATPRGANHRPRNGGSCARVSSSRATISLGKMEEESHAPLSRSLSSSSPSHPPSISTLDKMRRRREAWKRGSATRRESNERRKRERREEKSRPMEARGRRKDPKKRRKRLIASGARKSCWWKLFADLQFVRRLHPAANAFAGSGELSLSLFIYFYLFRSLRLSVLRRTSFFTDAEINERTARYF